MRAIGVRPSKLKGACSSCSYQARKRITAWVYFLTVPAERSCSCKKLHHTSSNSRGIQVSRSVLIVVTRFCIGLPDPKNISRCFFDDLVQYFKRSSEHESHPEYSTKQREMLFSR